MNEFDSLTFFGRAQEMRGAHEGDNRQSGDDDDDDDDGGDGNDDTYEDANQGSGDGKKLNMPQAQRCSECWW